MGCGRSLTRGRRRNLCASRTSASAWPVAALSHPRLAAWRFFVELRPFHRHVLFYEIVNDEVILRRVLHGHRHLPQRLLEPPGAE
jgi:plasmid stabilization system protein ParE